MGLFIYAGVLSNPFFSVAHFIVKIQYIVHEPHKVCVNGLLMLSERPTVG